MGGTPPLFNPSPQRPCPFQNRKDRLPTRARGLADHSIALVVVEEEEEEEEGEGDWNLRTMGDDGRKRRRTTTMEVGLRGGSCTSVDTGSATSTVIDSSNTEWTDEKHSLYLNSVEESFVNQLYGHDNDSHGWLSRSRKDQHSLGPTLNGLCSDQFKVQRKGCWEEIKYERPKTQTNAKNEQDTLVVNPWIKHFGSSNTGGHRHHGTAYRVTCSSKKLPWSRDAYVKVSSLPAPVYITHFADATTSAIEVSDQNFAENECEVERKSSRACKKKRLRNNSGTDASAKDVEM